MKIVNHSSYTLSKYLINFEGLKLLGHDSPRNFQVVVLIEPYDIFIQSVNVEEDVSVSIEDLEESLIEDIKVKVREYADNHNLAVYGKSA